MTRDLCAVMHIQIYPAIMNSFWKDNGTMCALMHAFQFAEFSVWETERKLCLYHIFKLINYTNKIDKRRALTKAITVASLFVI